MAIEKLKKKAAWQLYAGANDVDPSTANIISKHIDEYDKAIKYADEEEKEYINVEDFIPSEYTDLFRQSNDYQGITINLKVHACGVLLLDDDIRREVGLITATSETTGKRTVCACVEGNMLDDLGFVKEDFLIVDSVHLTYKFFKSIGQPVPSFEKLREMIRDDKPTWDIYEKGITCCVNQCEKEATKNKVMKYKPKNIAELSAFIAGIRPGFSSLLNTFLRREPYTTGEESVDELLKDSSHFMLYQESIMKVLSFLGLPMGETYGVIKSISKKKLKGEKKDKLLKELKEGWQNKFGNLDNFERVWKVIEDSAAYSFNAPHAYSMAGDSLYQAWFKAHYTKEFYEVAINHYQSKNNKEKISALIKEATKFFGFKMADYKFGNDNRKCTIQEKTIYPNISSIKGFGETVAEELYELGQDKYNNFTEVIEAVNASKINNTVFSNLIKINYFCDYGDVNTLLDTLHWYDLVRNAKTITKDKAEKNGIPFDILQKHGHETEKQFNKIDGQGLYEELIQNIPYRELTIREKLEVQNDILGVISIIEPNMDKRKYFVSEIDEKKTVVNIKLYEIYSGITREVKMWSSSFNRNPFEKDNILYVNKVEKKNKREPSGEINPSTGKKIYVAVPDKFEYWLSKYRIERGENDPVQI